MLFCHIISFRTAFRHAASALAFACGVAALSAQPQPAEPQRAMSLVQLAELPRLFDPQLSPDGKSVIYMAPDHLGRRACRAHAREHR
jgi:hypothetical protein